jgi:hypothetical protein
MALSYRICLEESLNIEKAWHISSQGAVLHHSLGLVETTDADGRPTLAPRITAVTGRRFDAPRILAPPGRLCFAVNPAPDLVGGIPKAFAAIYIGPEFTSRNHRVFDFVRNKYVTTRNVHVLHEANAHPLALALNGTLRPAGTLFEPAADAVEARLSGLLADHTHTPQDDLAVTVLALNPTTGMPASTYRIVPSLDSTGAIVLTPEATTPPDAAVAERTTAPAVGSFTAPPDSAFTQAGALEDAYTTWFRALPHATRVEVNLDELQRLKPDGTTSPSYTRR